MNVTSLIHRAHLLNILTVVISIVITLVSAELLMALYSGHVQSKEYMDDGLIKYHKTLGWKLSSGWRGRHRHFDYDVKYSTDYKGFRTSTRPQQEGKTKVLVLGDSFTFGLGVNDSETYVSLLNENSPFTEFINGGTPGYSPDQLMLQLPQAGKLVMADHFVLVVYLGNDLIDLGLPYPVQAVNGKPFVIVDDEGKLEVKNTPVPKEKKPAELSSQTLGDYIVGDRDRSWYLKSRIFQLLNNLRPSRSIVSDQALLARLEPGLEAFDLVLSQMNNDSRGELTLVILPGSSVVSSPDSISARYQLLASNELLQIAKRQGLVAGSLISVLQGTGGERLYYPNDGHLTPRGHEVVADELSGFLKRS